ncbi:hypothetical protein FRC04_001931 [Tulasnella sp. 424]|nr:hypothetical protein FRC04_001931 [Tulasnella sp. 424]KAG8977708.1 hypothetical protein FRC05_000964 [Tulasnella sp. 425]
MSSQSLITPPDTIKGYEWTVRIRCIVSELGTNFSVHLFLGPVPELSVDRITNPNYVGSFNTYYDEISSNAEKILQGGGSRGAKLTQRFVHLSRDLAERGVQTLEPENVVPYLKSNLNWCVEKRGCPRERVDLHDLPSLEVMVLEVPLTLSPGESVPEIGPPKEHPDITRGKEGGAK